MFGKQKLPCIASLLGANPADRRVLQAFPNMPDFAKEIADSIRSLCGTSAGVELLWFFRMAFPSEGFQIHLLSFTHNLHKTSMHVCLRRLPLRKAKHACVLEASSSEEGKTHFGNMNNLSQKILSMILVKIMAKIKAAWIIAAKFHIISCPTILAMILPMNYYYIRHRH